MLGVHFWGFLGGSQKSSRFLSTKSGRFCVCCVNTHIYTFATFCARTKSAKSENVQSVHAKFKVLRYWKSKILPFRQIFSFQWVRFSCCFIYCQKWGYFGGSKIESIFELSKSGSISRGLKTWFFGVEKTRFFGGLIFEHFLMYRFCRVSNPGGGKTSILRVQNLGFGGSKYRLFGGRCMGIHAFRVSKRGFLGILWDSRIKF